MLCHTSKWLLFPSSCQKLKGIFLQHSLENQVSYSLGFSFPGTGSFEDFSLRVSALVKFWFSVSACVFHVLGGSLPCDLTSVMDQRRVIDFFVCLFNSLLVVGMGWWRPSSLHAGLETWCFSLIFEEEFFRYRILGGLFFLSALWICHTHYHHHHPHCLIAPCLWLEISC